MPTLVPIIAIILIIISLGAYLMFINAQLKELNFKLDKQLYLVRNDTTESMLQIEELKIKVDSLESYCADLERKIVDLKPKKKTPSAKKIKKVK